MIIAKPLLRSPHASAAESLPPGVVLRDYRETDHADLLRLYHEGMLSEGVNASDPAEDPQHIFDMFQSRSQDHLWVAEAEGRVIASIGLTRNEQQVAHVRRLRVEPEYQKWESGQLVRTMVATAVEHARACDSLKLVIHTPVNDERAIAFLHKLGFEFARIRDREGRHLLEFYLDIYQPMPGTPSSLQATH